MANHYEGQPAKVQGAKKGEIWVWHYQRYDTPERTKGFWTTVCLKVIVDMPDRIVSMADAEARWQLKNDK